MKNSKNILEKIMNKIIITSVITINAILLTSCGPKMPTYIDPSINYNSMTKGGIVVFPPGGSKGSNSISNETARIFAEKLDTNYPKINILGPRQTKSIIAKNNLIEEYIALLSTNVKLGIWDNNKLMQLSKAFESRYLVFPIINIRYHQEMQFDLLDSTTSISDEYNVKLDLMIWDSKNKKNVFENSSEGEPGSSFLNLFQDPKYRAAEDAADEAVEFFPFDK